MNIKEIYGTIFPINVDNNNRYINMNGNEISTVQITEPSLNLPELLVPDSQKADVRTNPYNVSYKIPLVQINNFIIPQTLLIAFTLDYSSFLPMVSVEFIDVKNELLSKTTLKDGSKISVYIGGMGDAKYYKPIRQDFIITDVKKTASGRQNLGDYIQYRLTGQLNIPVGYKKESWSNIPCTSKQELFNVSAYTGLGFATNFTYDTIDKMKWINPNNSSYIDFMKEITKHACYSPNTFFTSFIDQYNVLNFIECRCLLSHGGKKTDIPAMLYSSTEKIKDTSSGGKETINDISEQKLSYYYISNNDYFSGWTNYIIEYTEITNCYSSLSDGYKRHVNYTDSNIGNWGASTCEFEISPIDNLERDSKQKIKELGDINSETYIPLNLMQTTTMDYQNDSIDNVNDLTEIESFSYFGEVDTSNTYKLYYFASAQNDFQMKCLKKCGLKVVLQNYNPSITKFSRIWVDIYDKNPSSSNLFEKEIIYDNYTDEYKNTLKGRNDNKLVFDDEGTIETQNGKTTNKNYPRGAFNRSLSGWYVVTEIKFIYNKNNLNINTQLILNRIDYKPAFKHEYLIAKNAIKKYREDNVIENLFKKIDN